MYWLVSLPLVSGRQDRTWELVQEVTANLSSTYKFEVPELRVGTLDTLMTLSDELIKTNALVDGVVHKIRRQVGDLSGAQAQAELKVDGLAPEAYLCRFRWDEAKYPARRPLRETVDKIGEMVSRLEDQMKVKASEYNASKGAVSAANRKAGGSLAVRDVAGVVKPDQLVDTENLCTVFVVITKFGRKDFEASYERLCDFIVPRSAKVLAEDNDYALYGVVLFKRVVDDFRAAARLRGWVVRELNPEAQHTAEMNTAQTAELRQELDARKAALDAWCRTAFGEAFSCWVHICAIRLFVESILRYGLPPAFRAAVIKPHDKQEARLRAALAKAFENGKSQYWKEEGGSGAMGALAGGDSELHPYVSFSINPGD